jgi:hypothetical protein
MIAPFAVSVDNHGVIARLARAIQQTLAGRYWLPGQAGQ